MLLHVRQKLHEVCILLGLRQLKQLVGDGLAHILDRTHTFVDGLILPVEEVAATGHTPFRIGDFYAIDLHQFGAVGDVVVVLSIVQERRDKLHGIVVTEVAAQVSQQAVGNAVVIAELVRGAVLNDLQELLGLVLGDAAFSG